MVRPWSLMKGEVRWGHLTMVVETVEADNSIDDGTASRAVEGVEMLTLQELDIAHSTWTISNTDDRTSLVDVELCILWLQKYC